MIEMVLSIWLTQDAQALKTIMRVTEPLSAKTVRTMIETALSIWLTQDAQVLKILMRLMAPLNVRTALMTTEMV
jgi:dsDNA-binding SOS-regulon protein